MPESENAAARKPRLATVWLGGCSGCHMSFLDLDERLLDLAQKADVVFTPIADVKVFPADVDVTLVEGAVANEDHLEMLRTVRERSRRVIAFGDCAVTGNVTALRNLVPVEAVLQTAYVDRVTAHAAVPEDPGIVPRLLPRVAPLHHVVPVDAYLPGCPPPADRIWSAVLALLDGDAPRAESAAPTARFG